MNYPVIIPPAETQRHIAEYLDERYSKIDDILQKTKQSIEEYKKLKQSIITEAVTGKLDESRKMKLGLFAEFKNGLNYTASDFGKQIKFLGVGDFKDYTELSSPEQFSDIITSTIIEDDYLLKNGDIVFVRSNGSKELVGRSIMVQNIDFPVTYSGFCIRLRNKRKDLIDDKFLLYFFRSSIFRNELNRLSQGSNINNINQELLSMIKIEFPPLPEQIAIAEYLDKKCLEIDSLITKKEQLAKELENYKKSLIYECVTGKIEV